MKKITILVALVAIGMMSVACGSKDGPDGAAPGPTAEETGAKKQTTKTGGQVAPPLKEDGAK